MQTYTSPTKWERSARVSAPGEGATIGKVPRAAPSPASLTRRDLSHFVGEVYENVIPRR